MADFLFLHSFRLKITVADNLHHGPVPGLRLLPGRIMPLEAATLYRLPLSLLEDHGLEPARRAVPIGRIKTDENGGDPVAVNRCLLHDAVEGFEGSRPF